MFKRHLGHLWTTTLAKQPSKQSRTILFLTTSQLSLPYLHAVSFIHNYFIYRILYRYFLCNQITVCKHKLEMAYLSNHIGDYPGICQGKTRITGVNDGEEFELTDVSWGSLLNGNPFPFRYVTKSHTSTV